MDINLVKKLVNVAGSVGKLQHIQILKLERPGKLLPQLIAKQEMWFTNWAVIWIKGSANFSNMKAILKQLGSKTVGVVQRQRNKMANIIKGVWIG